MNKASYLATLLCVASLAVSAAEPNEKIVSCGASVDVQSKRLTGPIEFAISDGKLVDNVSANADKIDLSDATCLPGLIDMHVHLSMQNSPRSYLENFTLNNVDLAFRSTNFAKKTINAGFTTVRNLGDDGTVTRSLRDAVNQGIVVGPRIFTAGKSIATTGGHADPSNGVRAELLGDPRAKQGVANGPIEARKAVRQRYKERADLIKITATGGVLSTAKSGQNPQFMEDELEAIIATANDYGFKVAAHAHGADGMKRAIRAGVSSIEHGTLMDDETRKLMLQNGTYLVPTILAGEFVAQKAEIDGYFPEIVRPKARRIGPQLKANFKKAVEAGVKIAFGTDSGVSAHGDNAKEFKLMVDNGMTAMQAIVAATVSAADLLGESETLGSLEVGKAADIVAVNGNPLDDITLLENVSFVMKAGEVIKAESKLIEQTASVTSS